MKNLASSNPEIHFKEVGFNELPAILSNLKKDWPHSIHTYYFLLNFVNWTKQHWNGEFNFYCPDVGSSTKSVMAVVKFKDGHTFVQYHCLDEVSCKSIHKAIKHTNVLHWDQLLIFEAIHERLVPGLQEIIQEKGLRVIKNDKCFQVWMPPTRVRSLNESLPPQITLCSLDGNHTQQIHRYWGYSGPGTEVIVRDSLTLNGGLGLRIGKNHSYVGWSVEQHYGGIGMLYVHPEYRRQGYAAALVKTMGKQAVLKGIDPFAIIEENNNMSRNLFEKLHFEHICTVHWIGVQAG
ncbi:uncharacterized protein LOC128989548 [Macrosteles quadrilineatus]|uniref:uncharacterized protein LOC128989259 n=1 Tax=Macrosteles quadrilineatus TaxID=74068 RepID=UPI0023E200CE|nr:uncharacterized protein LOC128989259 [Macrosteles quadrilineatus]XP_054267422.1 uncharacterized protein LOC128989548 [Macrosteles quadrilineatus]